MGVYELSEEQFNQLMRGLGPGYSSYGNAMAHYSLAGMYGQSYIVRGESEQERSRRARAAIDSNGAGALASVREYGDRRVEITTDEPEIEAKLRDMGIRPGKRSREAEALQSIIRGGLPGETDISRLRTGLPRISPDSEFARRLMRMLREGPAGDYRLTPQQYRQLMDRLEGEGYMTSLDGPYSPFTGQAETIRKDGQEVGRANVICNRFTGQASSVTITTDDPRIRQELSRMGIERQPPADIQRRAPEMPKRGS